MVGIILPRLTADGAEIGIVRQALRMEGMPEK